LEIILYADENSADSDGDGFNDYSEIFSGTLLNVSDATAAQDPLFEYQWHLKNRGQTSGANNPGVAGIDLNVTPVWPMVTGNKNITVAVIDTGIEANHTDFAYQIDLSKSYRYSDDSNDPSPDENQLDAESTSSAHGTAVAGIIAAKSNNGIGVKGIAPDITLVGLNVFSEPTDANFADALSKEARVLSNSWGINPIYMLSSEIFDAIVEDGSKNQQNIYVFAAGNERYEFGNANFSGLLTTPYTINVAALDANGTYSSYSNYGANILVTAPAGEFGVEYPAIVTTDISGLNLGFDNSVNHFDIPGNEDGNYTNRMNGTSSACPCVSGTVALMLSVNPNLTYREVTYILAHTARKVDPEDINWSTNGAGLQFNPNYGFGLVDAYSAVTMAKNFQNLPSLQTTQDYTYEQELAIADNDSNGISFTIEVTQDISIEYVNLWLDIDHTYLGDLEITLTSPSGTVSKLSYVSSQFNNENLNNWRFGSVQFMDESSRGTWKVTIRDLVEQDTGTFKKATLRIYGH
jgi:subtilisin family serine protease